MAKSLSQLPSDDDLLFNYVWKASEGSEQMPVHREVYFLRLSLATCFRVIDWVRVVLTKLYFYIEKIAQPLNLHITPPGSSK